jgi:hypothetical protein
MRLGGPREERCDGKVPDDNDLLKVMSRDQSLPSRFSKLSYNHHD